MKIYRAIIIALIIWILGVSAFSLSFLVPILENAQQQANLVLVLTVLPLVWFGSKLYYQTGSKAKGHWVGLSFFSIAALLDALITVPFLVVPSGGSYLEFYTDPGFWCIGLLFIGVPSLYHHLNVKPNTEF